MGDAVSTTRPARVIPVPAAATPPASDADTLGGLAARARAGDHAAFAELVRATERAVMAICRGVAATEDEAEDIAQEAYLKAWRALGRFDARRPFAPWMYRIASSAAIDSARRRARQPRSVTIDLVPEPASSASGPAEGVWLEQARRCVGQALCVLGADVALLYHWRYVEELSVEEIAARLGRRPNTVAVSLHRLRDAVRRQLTRQGDLKP